MSISNSTSHSISIRSLALPSHFSNLANGPSILASKSFSTKPSYSHITIQIHIMWLFRILHVRLMQAQYVTSPTNGDEGSLRLNVPGCGWILWDAGHVLRRWMGRGTSFELRGRGLISMDLGCGLWEGVVCSGREDRRSCTGFMARFEFPVQIPKDSWPYWFINIYSKQLQLPKSIHRYHIFVGNSAIRSRSRHSLPKRYTYQDQTKKSRREIRDSSSSASLFVTFYLTFDSAPQ